MVLEVEGLFPLMQKKKKTHPLHLSAVKWSMAMVMVTRCFLEIVSLAELPSNRVSRRLKEHQSEMQFLQMDLQ